MKIILCAIPGSGKTTITNKVKQKLPNVRIVNVGNIIFEIVKKELNIKDRDEMRKKLTIKQNKKYQEMAAKEISKMNDKFILIDTHTSIKTEFGYFPTLSEKISELINPDIIVICEYNPSDIINRRLKDPNRKRDLETESEMEKTQKIMIEFAYEAASHVGAIINLISLRYPETKKFEHTDKIVNEIVKLMKLK